MSSNRSYGASDALRQRFLRLQDGLSALEDTIITGEGEGEGEGTAAANAADGADTRAQAMDTDTDADTDTDMAGADAVEVEIDAPGSAPDAPGGSLWRPRRARTPTLIDSLERLHEVSERPLWSDIMESNTEADDFVDIEVPQPLIDLFPYVPPTTSGTTGRRPAAPIAPAGAPAAGGRASRSLVSDYIAATARADTEAADDPSILSLDQLLGPAPTPPTEPQAQRRTTLADILTRMSADRVSARSRGERERDPDRDERRFAFGTALGMSWPNNAIEGELGRAERNRDPDRNRDRERDRDRPGLRLNEERLPWARGLDAAQHEALAAALVTAAVRSNQNLPARERARPLELIDVTEPTMTVEETMRAADAIIAQSNALLSETEPIMPSIVPTPVTEAAPAPAATAREERTDGIAIANRARRTILQDSAPRPRNPAPVQVVPTGMDFSWVSYVPTRNTSAAARGSARANTATPAPAPAAATTAAATTAHTDSAPANDPPAPPPAMPLPIAPTPASTVPALRTLEERQLQRGRNRAERLERAERVSRLAAEWSERDGLPNLSDRPGRPDRVDRAVDRLASAVLRHRRPDGTVQRRIYEFDPTDIAPPGGADDHIWDMMGEAESDDDEGWGLFSNAIAGMAGEALAAWRPPEAGTGASLSRGGFNRRRQSLRAAPDPPGGGGDAHMDDWDVDVVVGYPPRPPVVPTNAGRLLAAPPPVVVSERGTRPRPGDMDEDEDDAESSGAKRQKTVGPPLRPSYLWHTTLDVRTPLPSVFAPPDMRSHLELSGTADGRPVVMYVVSAADRASGRKLHPAAVHTVERIPAGIGAYYFEAEVLELGDKANITLGFMPPAANMRRLVGWDKGTFGWHGDDGMVFEQDEHGRTYSDPWQVGEIIGMGIDYTQARVFLTRNGKLLGHVFSDMPTSALHVAVGLQSAGERVALNFTGPFSYDIDTHIRGIRDRVRSSLTSPPVPFSGPSSNTARIPRLSGPLPAGTKLPPHSIADAGDRAAAALVLDHLDTNGHARVAAMLRESMSSSRGWLVEQPAPPPIEEAADKPAEAYASPGAAASALVSLVSASGTPRMPLALLACAPLPAAVSRRIKVYELAALAAEASASVSAASERMDVDDDNDVNDAKDEDTRSDTSDADTRVLAVARALRLAAKHERWDSADIALLDAAGAVLAGGAMRARAEETVREARMRDVPVIGRCAREALGVKHHSLLHRAVAQTGLALDVLAQCGDGDAAFVSVREQLGLDAK